MLHIPVLESCKNEILKLGDVSITKYVYENGAHLTKHQQYSSRCYQYSGIFLINNYKLLRTYNYTA